MNALAGLMGPRAIGQGVLSAFEAGKTKRADMETQSALSAFAVDPNDEQAFQKLAQYRPEMAIQVRQQRDKAQQEAQARDLQGRAASGDQQALAELAGVDLDAWSKIGTQERATIKQRTDAVGQAALFVSQQPPEQRAAAWDSMVDQLSVQYPDLAPMKGQYSEQAVQGALASAGQVKAFLDTQKVDYKVIPQGARYVPFSGATGLPLNDDIAQSGGPKPGTVEGGHRYKGGDPADPASWEPVQGGPAPVASGNFRGLAGERVTSGYRTPERNRAVKGVPNSYHTRRDAQGRPLARDSVPPPGMSMGAYAAKLRRLNPDMEVINEGDHVHLEPRG